MVGHSKWADRATNPAAPDWRDINGRPIPLDEVFGDGPRPGGRGIRSEDSDGYGQPASDRGYVVYRRLKPGENVLCGRDYAAVAEAALFPWSTRYREAIESGRFTFRKFDIVRRGTA